MVQVSDVCWSQSRRYIRCTCRIQTKKCAYGWVLQRSSLAAVSRTTWGSSRCWGEHREPSRSTPPLARVAQDADQNNENKWIHTSLPHRTLLRYTNIFTRKVCAGKRLLKPSFQPRLYEPSYERCMESSLAVGTNHIHNPLSAGDVSGCGCLVRHRHTRSCPTACSSPRYLQVLRNGDWRVGV